VITIQENRGAADVGRVLRLSGSVESLEFARNTFVNHETAPHAFDLVTDSETTREIIRQILAFMRAHLADCPFTWAR